MKQRNEEPNELQVIFNEIHSDLSIEDLAFQLQATISNNTIDFSCNGGSGFIKKIKIDNDFTLRVWDYSYPHPIIFTKPADEKGKSFFHICYPINTADFLVSNSFYPQLVHLPWGRNIVFFSADAAISMKTFANKRFKAIDVSFTGQWLINTFSEDHSILKAVDELINTSEPLILMDSASPAEQLTVLQIHQSANSEKPFDLQLKAKILLLIDEFFSRLSKLGKEQLQGKKIVYDEQIQSVKKILVEYLEQQFPGIETIAAKVALSESTVKRYFKTVFNQSIYEHYLQLKMEHAKKLISENHLTVNEVATILKYEKVSSFIESFKKHYGYSPGKLKKNIK